ncbi:MAG TPA: exopolyphosphatase [Burkholderiales bacterium]|nr:exopolyphosphatase [Burkholderiales bacterium]
MSEQENLAAVDLGSNSFRLQVVRVVGDQIYELDSLKETVRLAGGLDSKKNLSESCQENALKALKRFGERLRGFSPASVRAVGTNTLRVAKNAPSFLNKAETALGFPIEVIAGREEARLIYVGVAHGLPLTAERRLVVDIGGGSTECIIGEGLKPIRTESLYMGCVSYTGRFFPDGRIDEDRLIRAELAARTEVETIGASFDETGWSAAIGSSGTARAIGEMLRANGWADSGITRAGLKKLRSALLKAGDVKRLHHIDGLGADRAPIIAGGFAIMSGIFNELDLSEMTLSDYALRHGVLYDLLGRTHHHDMREATVNAFMHRYEVDRIQAARIEISALDLYKQIARGAATAQSEHDRQLLTWAARLHEVGISIAYSGYHKHSAYIIQNADMPGFSRMDQAHLALIVQAHRGSLAKSQAILARPADLELALSLRLATLLSRGRGNAEMPIVKLTRRENGFEVTVEKAWLKHHPLTDAALDDDISQWQSLGVDLRLKRLG